MSWIPSMPDETTFEGIESSDVVLEDEEYESSEFQGALKALAEGSDGPFHTVRVGIFGRRDDNPNMSHATLTFPNVAFMAMDISYAHGDILDSLLTDASGNDPTYTERRLWEDPDSELIERAVSGWWGWEGADIAQVRSHMRAYSLRDPHSVGLVLVSGPVIVSEWTHSIES